jgi:hypothetical protein
MTCDTYVKADNFFGAVDQHLVVYQPIVYQPILTSQFKCN